jgi:DNA repair protein RecO (recombination protein O)
MPHPFQRTEGIVLRAIPFRDYDHILSLFTPEAGMMKLLVHASRSKRRGLQGLCIPLTKVEVVYREKEGEIFSCQEMALIEPYAHVRTDLNRLEAACDLLHAVCCSQLVGKPAPLLYELLCFFLERIPQAASPAALALCFRLKLLKHEGLAAFPLMCSSCGQLLLAEAYICGLEGWCMSHRPVGSFAWSQKSIELINRLAACQSYREICAEEITPQLQKQVTHFFEDCLKL